MTLSLLSSSLAENTWAPCSQWFHSGPVITNLNCLTALISVLLIMNLSSPGEKKLSIRTYCRVHKWKFARLYFMVQVLLVFLQPMGHVWSFALWDTTSKIMLSISKIAAEPWDRKRFWWLVPPHCQSPPLLDICKLKDSGEKLLLITAALYFSSCWKLLWLKLFLPWAAATVPVCQTDLWAPKDPACVGAAAPAFAPILPSGKAHRLRQELCSSVRTLKM